MACVVAAWVRRVGGALRDEKELDERELDERNVVVSGGGVFGDAVEGHLGEGEGCGRVVDCRVGIRNGRYNRCSDCCGVEGIQL